MTRQVLFVHGAGDGAWEADARLAASLTVALGPGYAVRNPQFPDEDEPDYQTWARVIGEELQGLGAGAVLVGHSVGGTMVARALYDGLSGEESGGEGLSGIFLVSTPFWHNDEVWHWPEGELPPDAAARFPHVPVFLYHGDADEVVPVAHLDMLAGALPQASVRRLAGRNHQLNDDLAEVAADIRGLG